MVITVQFKDKNKVFKGRTYDYLLNKEEELPQKGSIIRMMDNDYNYIYNGTRTRVVNVRKATKGDEGLKVIRYINSTME